MERWKEESEKNNVDNVPFVEEASHSTDQNVDSLSRDDDIHADDEDDEHVNSPKDVKSLGNKKASSVKDDSPKKFVKKGLVTDLPLM